MADLILLITSQYILSSTVLCLVPLRVSLSDWQSPYLTKLKNLSPSRERRFPIWMIWTMKESPKDSYIIMFFLGWCLLSQLSSPNFIIIFIEYTSACYINLIIYSWFHDYDCFDGIVLWTVYRAEGISLIDVILMYLSLFLNPAFLIFY